MSSYTLLNNFVFLSNLVDGFLHLYEAQVG